MRQLPFMLMRLEKQRKSTLRFLKLELRTTVSACKSFFLTRHLDICCAQDGFPSFFSLRKNGAKAFPIVSSARQSSASDARLPEPSPLRLLSGSWLPNADCVGDFFSSPSASDYCDHSKKSRRNGWNHHLLKDLITSCALNPKIHLSGRIGFYISLSWRETAASTCPGISISGRRGPQ